jgi:hypothetical protein
MTARAGVFPGTGSTTLLHACRRQAMSFRKGTSSDQADLDRCYRDQKSAEINTGGDALLN